MYAILISLYVTPPAINKMMRCLPSVLAIRAEGALCHVGRADLSDPDAGAGWLVLADRNGEAVRCMGAASGASLT